MNKHVAITVMSLLVSSTSALAVDTDAVIGGAIGGGVGAAVGSEVGGRKGAIVGGAVGAAVGTAIATEGQDERPREKVVYVEDNEPEEKVIYVKEYRRVPPGHLYRHMPPGHAKHLRRHRHRYYYSW
jgi:outer membrane lipoprotein SlyB